MKHLLKILSAFFVLLAPSQLSAQDDGGIDEAINNVFQPIADAVGGVVFFPVNVAGIDIPIVLFVLILGALYFTLYFGFPNVRYFKLAINVVRGKYDNATSGASDNLVTDEGDIPDTIRVEGAEGEVTAFQALTAALSATVGLGNIAGVAIAIAIGGPGATFWMIVAGFLGMASKFTECTLGVKFREVDENGKVYGGPMYYLKKGFGLKGLGGLGSVFAVFYAIMLVGGSFGGGNMFQANQAAAQFAGLFGSNAGWAGTGFGIVTAILVGLVIIGGIKRIGKVAEKIVPAMVGLYVGAALIILLMNFKLIPDAFAQIFNGAFTGAGIVGGFIGVLIQGFQRAAFSNEAGVGSASVAHSAVKTKYAASEGVVALLEPFIDTIVVCTMTALVIIIYNMGGHFEYADVVNKEVLIDGARVGGAPLTAVAFDNAIPGFSYVLTIAIILFAFSTMLSWSYYGLQAWKFLFGRSKIADTVYKVLFCVMIVVGAASSLGSVVDFSDAMVFAMIFPNMIGLVILAPFVRDEVKKYLAAIKSGELNSKT